MIHGGLTMDTGSILDLSRIHPSIHPHSSDESTHLSGIEPVHDHGDTVSDQDEIHVGKICVHGAGVIVGRDHRQGIPLGVLAANGAQGNALGIGVGAGQGPARVTDRGRVDGRLGFVGADHMPPRGC